MSSATEQPVDTRESLLRSAAEVFAEVGFARATVAEICRRAGANIAAVNYYFHGKKAIYAEAWRAAFRRSLEMYPPDGGVDRHAPPAERLRGRVTSILRRMADPNTLEFDIVQKELANPTGLLTEAISESIGPLEKALTDIVRELIGPDADDERVGLCQMSIRGQCFAWLHHRRRNLPGKSKVTADVDAAAEHIVQFSLAGIADIRNRGERKGRAKR